QPAGVVLQFHEGAGHWSAGGVVDDALDRASLVCRVGRRRGEQQGCNSCSQNPTNVEAFHCALPRAQPTTLTDRVGPSRGRSLMHVGCRFEGHAGRGAMDCERSRAMRRGAAHCSGMLASRITFAHFSVSSTMKVSNSAGDIGFGTLPSSARCALMSASASAALICLLRVVMISGGVFFGAP